MSIFKRLFGRKNDEPSEEAIAEALKKFVTAETWIESQQIVEQNKNLLLADTTDSILADVLKRYQGNPKMTHVITKHRRLLHRCRKVGIANAFAELITTPEQTNSQTSPQIYIPPELQPIINELSQDTHPPNIPRQVELSHRALKLIDRDENILLWAVLQIALGNNLAQNPLDNQADNVEQAIYHFELALEVFTYSDFPEQWAGIQNNFGGAYLKRINGSRADNIEQAIDHFALALKVRTRAALPIDWAETQNNLGNAYNNRVRGSRTDNIERAIYHYSQALEVRTRTDFPNDWAQTQDNLASAYLDRINGRRADNVEQAIQHCTQALNVYTRADFPQDWAGTQNKLGRAYSNRIKGNRVDNLEQAIDHYQQALEVRTRTGFPQDWAGTRNNLAITYRKRIKGNRVDNLEQAIDHYQQSLDVYTRTDFPQDWAMTQNNLGNAYSDRIKDSRVDNLEQAIHHFKLALRVRTSTNSPADHLQTQRNLSGLFFGEQRWAEAQVAFEAAIEAGQNLLATAVSDVGRRAEVSTTAQLFTRTAYCQLKQGNVAGALLTLEQGKTRLLTETLALSGADLSQLPEAQRGAVETGRETVRQLEAEMRLPADTPGRRSDRELAQELGRARTELNQLIDTIRQDHPDFMPTGLALNQLLALIPPGGALIAPLVTSQGSAVFAVPHGAEVQGRGGAEEFVVWLDEFTEDDLNSLLIGTEKKPGWLRAYLENRAMPAHWFEAIDKLIAQLQEIFIIPVVDKLAQQGIAPGVPLLLMPQGGLGLLPLHALLLEEYPVTIVPSGYALHTAQQRVTEPHRQARSLLAITNPSNDLPFTPVEGEQVVNLFEAEEALELVGSAATLAAVGQQIEGRSHLHFSCHGYYQWDDAMQSGLILANDEWLTLSHLISQIDLSAARLVVLSACETGITEVRQSPDEFVGLPAGFLQAGAPAIISTLWAVNDLSTMLLMEQFYTRYRQDGLDIAEALRQAQLWLRNVTAADLAQRFSDERQVLLASTRMPGEVVSQQFRRFNRMEPEDKPFEHPYYWAAFTFSGA